MQEAIVSIIIPHYNRLELLLETLESVRCQSHQEFECLIVDDGSDKDSCEAIHNWISQDNRFRLISRNRTPKGAPTCRNMGMQQATGDYLMFLDSDDLMAPYCLEQRLKLFSEFPDNDFIVCQTALFRHDQHLADRMHSSLKHDDDLQAFINMQGWGTSSPIFKTDFIKQRSWDEQAMSWQDIEFHLRLLVGKPSYQKFPSSEPDVFKRFGGGKQISATNIGFIRLSSLLHLFLRIEKILQQEPVEYKEQFLMFYFKFLEIGARTESYNNYEELMNIWKQSITYYEPKANLFRRYLSTQALLTKFGLYKIGSIPYRLIRPFFPNNVLDFSAKHVMLEKPIDLRALMQCD